MGRLADETFVSLLFIVLLAFFDYNMDMLKGKYVIKHIAFAHKVILTIKQPCLTASLI